jgi:CheY-like chemotaxis protein
LLHGVLANLVSNAIKYTRHGSVQIEVQVSGPKVVIAVRDTGLGIHRDKLDVIFKEFVRLDASEAGTEGLGLGLSIVKRYAALLGHRLTVESELLQGSCFGIEVPCVADHPRMTSVQAGRAAQDSRLAQLHVLVVDNVEMLLHSMERTISAWGCQVHSARNLDEAKSIARVQRLDLVISDFHLGDREPDGLLLIALLRQLQPGEHPLPCVLMTGDVSSHLEAQASQQGVRILHKPVRPAVLQNTVIDLLQRSVRSGVRPRTEAVQAPSRVRDPGP